jgi:hypothetical protein
MIEADASSNRLLKQVFEQGMEATYPLFLLGEIRDVMRRDGLTIDDALMEHMEGAEIDEIKAFSKTPQTVRLSWTPERTASNSGRPLGSFHGNRAARRKSQRPLLEGRLF